MEYKYDVFISYSRKDYVDEQKNVIPDNVISIIKDKLIENNISYWMDEEGNLTGKKFAHIIAGKIRESMIFIFVCSKNSVSSRWVDRELSVADTLNKHIIPFVCDDSCYDDKVIMFTSSLDRIEYHSNPQKELDKLISAIKKDKIELEEKNKKERLKKTQEEEEEKKRRQLYEEQQRRLISNIKLSCESLNNEEKKLEIEREKLYLETDGVADTSVRNSLKDFISSSSPIRKKLQEEKLELISKNEELYNELQKIKDERDSLLCRIDDAKSIESNKNQEEFTAVDAVGTMINKKGCRGIKRIWQWLQELDARYWLHLVTLAILLLIFVSFLYSLVEYNDTIGYLSIIIPTLGMIIGIVLLLLKSQKGLYVLIINGLVGLCLFGFISGISEILFCLPVYFLFCGILFLIHKTDKKTSWSWRLMKPGKIKRPKTFVLVSTIVTLCIWYSVPYLFALNNGLNSYSEYDGRDFLAKYIYGYFGSKYSVERVGDYFLNYYNDSFLKIDAHKAYEWYLKAGLPENNHKIELCKQYIEIEKNGYYSSDIYGKCGTDFNTGKMVKINIKNYSGGGLDRTTNYDITIEGATSFDSDTLIVEGGSASKVLDGEYKLKDITNDSVKITYKQNDKVVAERVVLLKKAVIDIVQQGTSKGGLLFTAKISTPYPDGIFDVKSHYLDVKTLYSNNQKVRFVIKEQAGSFYRMNEDKWSVTVVYKNDARVIAKREFPINFFNESERNKAFAE